MTQLDKQAADLTTDMRRAPTMTDVAEKAGVSQTTVSLVLNGAVGARLSAETRQRVQDAADALGYRLVKRATNRAPGLDKRIIAVVVDELTTDPWCAISIDSIRDKAWENGLAMQVSVTRGDPEIEEAVFAQLAGQPLLGMIYGRILTHKITPRAAFYRQPTVLMNCYVADKSVPSFVPGEVLGARTATECLIEAGHRRIAFIEGQGQTEVSRDRLKGYRNALASHDIPFDADLVRPGNWEPSAGYEQTTELMRLKQPPTAIYCSNDLTAMGCYEALKALGLRIPDDISVVGYDDRPIAHFLRPPLTTVLLPHAEIGQLAADYLIDNATASPFPSVQTKVACPLIERASVTQLRAISERRRSG
jgi:LacI family transcriptional regulator